MRTARAQALNPRHREGLVGHWIGSGSFLRDWSGYGNHAFYRKGRSILDPRGVQGIFSDASAGGPAAIVDANDAEFDFEYTMPFSVSFWARKSSNSDTSARVLAKNSATTLLGWRAAVNQTYGFIFGLTVTNGTDQLIARPTTVPTITDWHHYAGTYDGSNALSAFGIYVDGVAQSTGLVGSPSSVSGSILNNAKLDIGGTTSGADSFDGAISDIRVYQRVLSAAEVAALASPGFLPFM